MNAKREWWCITMQSLKDPHMFMTKVVVMLFARNITFNLKLHFSSMVFAAKGVNHFQRALSKVPTSPI